MKKESFPEEAQTNQQSVEGQHIAAEDLKFIRSVIEKTHRAFKPGAPIIIVWGLIFMIGYPVTQYCLTTPPLHEFLQPMWIIMQVRSYGLCVIS